MKKILIFCFIFIFPAVVSADLYRILGVMSYSPLETITKNYERSKKRIHPDHNSNSRESRERFQELEDAYAILSDLDRRSQYDEHLKKIQTVEESNFYKNIGVLSDSSLDQIIKAYRERRSVVHPDRNNNNEESNRRFKELQRAFRTLADTELRLKHDVSLGKSYVLPRFNAEREQRQRDLKEQALGRQGREETVRTGTDREEQGSTEGDAAAWNKQVFELAQELEKEGGSKDREEAIFWYRMLAQEDHLQATWRLAPLLEKVNINEALYRYNQAQMLDLDGEFARSSIFRQAQIYQTGVYEEEKTIFPPNPEKAAELYEEAFRLGVSPQDIARQYDRYQDYQKALEWQHRKSDTSSQQQTAEKTNNGSNRKITGTKDNTEANQAPKNTELHLAIFRENSSEEWKRNTHDRKITKMIRSVFKGPVDIDAQNSKGKTPLALAIEKGLPRAARFLLNKGANPVIPDQNGNNALHRLMLSGRNGVFYYMDFLDTRKINQNKMISLARIMIKTIKGNVSALLSARNNKGQLPLHLSILMNLPQIAEFLIAQGGAESLTEEEINFLVQEAIQREQRKVVQLLKKRLKKRNSIKESDSYRLPTEESESSLFDYFNDLCQIALTREKKK